MQGDTAVKLLGLVLAKLVTWYVNSGTILAASGRDFASWVWKFQ
jgi:hypothetical protein